MSDLTVTAKWLAIQYQLTNVDTLLRAISAVQETNLNAVMNQYVSKLNVDTADGVWLDYLGYRLGVLNRPSVARSGDFFGFDGTGENFDQAPFASESADRVPIDDDIYRKFLKSRALQLITDGTQQDIIDALKLVFEDAIVINNYNMTMSVFIITAMSTQVVEALIADGVIIRPAGVEIIGQIVSGDLFGFDGTALGFDQAPFIQSIGI